MRNNKIKAIFFDQDNTIFNTSTVSKQQYFETMNSVATKLDLDFSDLYNEWREFIKDIKLSKDPAKREFSYSLGEVLKRHDKYSEEFVDRVVERFNKALIDKIEFTKGTKQFFESVDLGLKYVLFTEDAEERNFAKLQKFNLLDNFDLVLNSTKMGIMKPDIKYLEKSWTELGLQPEECIYVGDNWKKDCKLGQERGGMGVVFGSEDTRADFSIMDMMELEEIVSSI